jgi:hypothetical protein
MLPILPQQSNGSLVEISNRSLRTSYQCQKLIQVTDLNYASSQESPRLLAQASELLRQRSMLPQDFPGYFYGSCMVSCGIK